MKPNTLINAARLAEKAGKTGLATTLYSRSAKGPSNQRAEALYRLANLKFPDGDPADVERLLKEAVGLQPDRAPWHYRLANVLEKQGRNAEAMAHYETATRLDPANGVWAQRLERCENTLRIAKAQADDGRAKSLRRKGARWQELEILLNASDNFSKSPDWFLRLGDAFEAMGRFEEAALAFEKGNKLRPNKAENLAREGYCWRMAGFPGRAEVCFRIAKDSDSEHDSKRLGVGVFLERRGMWFEAAAQYEADCEKQPMDAELQFRAGRALERSYSFEDAASRYGIAATLARNESRYHFRLGFTYERMHDYAAAEDCYAYGISLPSKTAPAKYWSYRLGVVREAQGNLESAIAAYSESLNAVRSAPTDRSPIDIQPNEYEMKLLQNATRLALRTADPAQIIALVDELEQREMWSEVVACLEAAADRNQAFNSAIFYRLGSAYERLGKLKESARAFRRTRISVSPRGIDSTRYNKDKTLLQYFEYAEMSDDLPIRDNVIFYESFFGKQITCNPYALFKQIFADSLYKEFVHVWSITDDTHIPAWMQNRENVVFAKRGTHLYRRYLATAKYLVNNVTFQSFFVRREEQKYLNTWHGTPMKTLGKDIGTGVLEHRNVSRNFLQATHIVTPNDHTTKVLLDRYDVSTLTTAVVGYTGYPRIDLTVGMDAAQKACVRGKLGIEPDETRKVVLYAPTWRGGAEFKHFDTERLVSDLQALSEQDCIVLFQGHHLSVSLLPADLPVRVVPEEVNTNELLAVVDVLVTDYSSIMYDFFPTRRPVICYVYDLDDYIEERGLYFTPGDLGLREVATSTALIAAVQEALSHPEIYRTSMELIDRFCAREDGNASERVASFFLEDDGQFTLSREPAEKTQILFHHSMLPNGISSSLTNLLKSLDPEEYDLTVIVPAGVIEKSDGGVGVLRGLPPYVKVLADGGRQVVNIEEKWVIDYFNKWNFLPSETQRDLYQNAFKREYRRLLGDATFDVIVEFEGYSRYWTSVLAAAEGDCRKVIYLHNDMEAERKVRFPYLRGVFEQYEHFDVLASVSPALSELNRTGVGQRYPGESAKFVPVINQIDPIGVEQRSLAPLDEDLLPWFNTATPTFVTMGRLSTEKDQAKLLRALALVLEEGLKANLVLIGDGPLKTDLEQLATELGLKENVYFAGLRENPFPALRAAQCFVLPSNHEGQPMVLLESMIIGTPIIATDIPGSRQVLSENPECIVDNSVEGLRRGLADIISGGGIPSSEFDARRYFVAAREAFLTLIE